MKIFNNKKAMILTLCLSIASLGILQPQECWGANVKESIAYKLALFHIRTLNPLDDITEPPQALISEFTWIMESLRARCINPETTLADTLIQTWQVLKSQGSKLSILDVSRELTVQAKNNILFGPGKVNFRMTSNYWLKQFLAKNRKR